MTNDARDARYLADPMRLGRRAEARIAPPEPRLRETVRFGAKLSNLRIRLARAACDARSAEGQSWLLAHSRCRSLEQCHDDSLFGLGLCGASATPTCCPT